MEKHNWLYHYQSREGINRALNGLSRRASFKNNMSNAAQLLLNHEQSIQLDFEGFLPEIRNFVKEHIKKGLPNDKPV